jgi:hypothetical protein
MLVTSFIYFHFWTFPPICVNLHVHELERRITNKVKVIWPWTASRPVSPSTRPPFGTIGQLLFLLRANYFKTFSVCSMERPLWREGVSLILFLQVLLGLVSAFALGSKSRRTSDYILLSHLRLGSLSVASNDSQACRGSILTCLHRRKCYKEVELVGCCVTDYRFHENRTSDTLYVVRLEVSTAVATRNSVLRNIKTHFVPHRRHTISPLEIPAG